MFKVDDYKSILASTEVWQPLLLRECGLPGRRANLTRSFAEAKDRHSDGSRALRKGLVYCWSVAAAAAPQTGRELMEQWMRTSDRDILWIMRHNLGKRRMAAAGPEWVDAWSERLSHATSATVARPPSAEAR